MISSWLHRARPARVAGYLLVGAFLALLASSYLQGAAPDPGPGPADPGTPAEGPASAAPPGVRVVSVTDAFTSNGLRVAYAVRPALEPADMTEVTFRLEDAATGGPVTPVTPPSVWIGRQAPAGASPGSVPTCEDRIKAYVQGTFDARPEIDLTSYFVLALNDDASISVINPLDGVAGISQLYAMVLLPGRGEDWVMSRDGQWLFVSMPEIGQVAVVSTVDFEVARSIDVGGTPVRMALRPDGGALWVADDPPDGAPGGVTVIDVATLGVVARLDAGAGEHEVVFSGEVADTHPHDGETGTATGAPTTWAFIANRTAGTVAIVDAERLEMDGIVDVGAPIAALDYSSAGDAVYVAGRGDDGITVIDASRHEITGRVETPAGVEALRFAPGGRWGFAASPSDDRVDVIDATTNRVVHSVEVAGAPDRIAFTAAQAYIHASERSDVALINLAGVGSPDTLQAVRVVGGEMPPARSPVALSVADPIVPIHEHGGHVLIANPGDKSVYYYMEGMNAAMGALVNYGRSPRAVGVVDRSIRQTAPGDYAATIRVPGTGEYQVAFLLDDPRVVHCFTFTAGSDPGGGAGDGPLSLRLLGDGAGTAAAAVTAGEPLAVKVAVVDARGEPVAGIADLQVLATLVSGQRSERFDAVAAGDAGTYEASVMLTTPGSYTLYFAIPSRGAGAGDLPSFPLAVTP